MRAAVPEIAFTEDSTVKIETRLTIAADGRPHSSGEENMKSQLCVAVVGLAVLAASGASAQSAPVGPYVQINLGSAVAGKTDVSASTVGFSGSEDADLDAGLFVSAAFGMNFDNNFALEGEVLHAKNDIDTADIDRALGTSLDASVKTTRR